MRRLGFGLWLLMEGILLVGCGSRLTPSRPAPTVPLATPADTVGPRFDRLTTSSQGFARFDCPPNAITLTVQITDDSGIAQVVLWHRVGSDRPFTPTGVDNLGSDTYGKTVKGTDVPGSEYGPWEFYLVAEDTAGNVSQSPVDASVSLLPCLG